MSWSSTLADDISESVATIRLTTPFTPRRSSNYLTIEQEVVEVRGGTDVLYVNRGVMGTEPVAHPAGVAVRRYGVYGSDSQGTASGTAAHPDLATHTGLGLAASDHSHGTASHGHAFGDLAGVSASGHSHGTASHGHAFGDLAGAAASGHAHDAAYAAAGHAHGTVAHGHAISDTSGLQAALDAKSGTAHTHATYALSGHTHAGGAATVKSGVVNLAAGGSAVVTFTTPFASTPAVMVTSAFNSADTSTTLSVFPVSTTGFTIRGAGNAAGTVAWIATDAGNP